MDNSCDSGSGRVSFHRVHIHISISAINFSIGLVCACVLFFFYFRHCVGPTIISSGSGVEFIVPSGGGRRS